MRRPLQASTSFVLPLARYGRSTLTPAESRRSINAAGAAGLHWRKGSLGDVFTAGQQAAVANAFSLAGYHGPLVIAPMTSDDERIFVLPPDAFGGLPDQRALEQVLQEILQRKVWIVEQSASWPSTEPFS